MIRELQFAIGNQLQELVRVQELATSFLLRLGASPRTVYVTGVALEEVLTNVIRHGYEDVATHRISICLRADGDQVEIQVEDDARPFDPTSVPVVAMEAPLDACPVGGHGVHLVRTLVKHVRYERTGDRNRLR